MRSLAWLTVSTLITTLSMAAPPDLDITPPSRPHSLGKRVHERAKCSPYFGEPFPWDCDTLINQITRRATIGYSVPTLFTWQPGASIHHGNEPVLPRYWELGGCEIRLLLKDGVTGDWTTWAQIIEAMADVAGECLSGGVDRQRLMGGWNWVQGSPLLVEIFSFAMRDCPVDWRAPDEDDIPEGSDSDTSCDSDLQDPNLRNARYRAKLAGIRGP